MRVDIITISFIDEGTEVLRHSVVSLPKVLAVLELEFMVWALHSTTPRKSDHLHFIGEGITL